MQQFGRPQQHPSAERDALAIVLQAAYLTRLHGNYRGIAHLQFPHAIRKIVGKLALDEQSIHPIVVQAVAEGLQLVVVDDAHQRVQLRSFHKAGIVVGSVNFQNLLHIGGKDSQNCLIMVENE